MMTERQDAGAVAAAAQAVTRPLAVEGATVVLRPVDDRLRPWMGVVAEDADVSSGWVLMPLRLFAPDLGVIHWPEGADA